MTTNSVQQPEPAQEWFTPAEAAAYLRVTRQTIYNYMDQGLLPYSELVSGGGRRIRRADLNRLLKPARKSGATKP